MQEQGAKIRPAGETSCFLGEPGSVPCRARGSAAGLSMNAADPTRADPFFSFITPGFWDFSLAVDMQTHKLYLEKSDDLRTMEFALLDFFFFFCLVFPFRGVN